MQRIAAFEVEGGGVVFVDGPNDPGGSSDGGLDRAGAGQRAAQATQQAAVGFRTALQTIRVTAEAAAAQLRNLAPGPEEVEVTFGLRLSAGLNAGVITSGGDANLNVRILWRGDRVPEPPPA